ncbi:hypothetical protein L7D48_01160 [Streptomyces sp. S1A]|uniref:hypothetical protein n=1 Tax=Streptomyces sp. ICN903 TaxID=2964654 RepID=UPI001EDB2527|nr:hypothetical protein [Streptomyces sp. ICN903]MCG3039192.1 hypothetical protein [Streptomyces sp. ICN903]
MSRYLEEAAALLRKSAQKNEESNAKYSTQLMEGRERIAQQFATLAAIDKGLLPADVIEDVLRTVAERRG